MAEEDIKIIEQVFKEVLESYEKYNEQSDIIWGMGICQRFHGILYSNFIHRDRIQNWFNEWFRPERFGIKEVYVSSGFLKSDMVKVDLVTVRTVGIYAFFWYHLDDIESRINLLRNIIDKRLWEKG